jgi:phosphoribosylpyrophosphate synthetase
MTESMASALERVRAVAQAPEDDQLFMAAEAGESLERALADPVVLTETSLRLVGVANDLGCKRVFGASALGQRLAGAVIALAANGLKDQTAGMQGEAVLVIDGLLVTGTQVASAARRARLGGADSVCAAVVASVEFDLEKFAKVAKTVVVLEP